MMPTTPGTTTYRPTTPGTTTYRPTTPGTTTFYNNPTTPYTKTSLQIVGGDDWTELTSSYSKTVNIYSIFNSFISTSTISFSFELNVRTNVNKLTSIFRVTNSNADFGTSGDRVPAVFIDENTKMFVAFDTVVNNNLVNYGTAINNNLLNNTLLIQGFIEHNNINLFINGINVLSNGILYNNPSESTNLIINDPFNKCNGGVFIKNFVIYNYIITPTTLG
jgi:hypothetical protein